MCSLCTPECVLQPPFFKHLIISPPINGFWAAGAFGSSSCVWCSRVLGHKVSGIWGCGAFSVCCRVFYCCHRVCHRVCNRPTKHITIRWSEKNGLAIEPTLANLQTRAYTTGPPLDTAIVLLRDHVQTERRKFFFQN